MKEIPLTRGKFAIVSDEDFEKLAVFRWYCDTKGYACRSVKINGRYTTEKMHRTVIMAKPGEEVDHIDGNPLNNTRKNLRLCTHAENQANRTRLQKNNTSGYSGVRKNRNKWCAILWRGGKGIYLGSFDTKEEAIEARKRGENPKA